MLTTKQVSSESIENNSNNHLKLPNSTSKKGNNETKKKWLIFQFQTAQNSNGAFDNIDDFVWLRSQEFFWPEMDKTAAEVSLKRRFFELIVRLGKTWSSSSQFVCCSTGRK